MRSQKSTRQQQLKQEERRIGLRMAIFMSGFLIIAGGLQISYFWYDAKAATPSELSIHAILPQPFAAGDTLLLEAVIKNPGTAEDRDIAINTAHGFGDFKTDDDAFEKLHSQFDRQKNSIPLLTAKESFKEEIKSGTPLRTEDYADLMSGKTKLYFFSKMKYSDAFSVPHQVDTCEYFDPSTSVMVKCSTHNSFH